MGEICPKVNSPNTAINLNNYLLFSFFESVCCMFFSSSLSLFSPSSMRSTALRLALVAVMGMAASHSSSIAQEQYRLTAPPSGNNQRASVTQYIGLVKITVDYNSPNVTSPQGQDRTGKIWGQLIPYGLGDSDFGLLQKMPWRAGANENTAISFSHDVVIEGQKLPAGRYGFHTIPGADEWTLIFSKVSTAWGSYFYREADDALRVRVKPQKSEFNQWLTYEFPVRKPNSAVCALLWENLKVPFTIDVPNINDYYVAEMRKELITDIGFSWQNWNQAAQFCVQNTINLEEALRWADYAVSGNFIGEGNFTTFSTKSQVLFALKRTAQADSMMNLAVNHPTATVMDIHTTARSLQTQGRKQDALKLFELNVKKNPTAWVAHWGLARGYSALGEYGKALASAQKALSLNPDESNKKNIQSGIEKLKANKDVN